MRDWDVTLDASRRERLGLPEAVYCESKSTEQIARIVELAHPAGPLLLTRLGADKLAALPAAVRARLDYDAVSRTAVAGPPPVPDRPARVAVVTAGSSDVAVAREAVRTLAFHREAALEVNDVGVAGLWRLLDRIDEIRPMAVVIAIAGMEGALPSVLGGLVPGAVIAVPSSAGYGVADGGRVALDAALASCAPGLVAVNIDNGYGAACAALRVLRGGQADERPAP